MGQRPVQIHAFENRSHDVECRKSIGTGIHDVHSQPLAHRHRDGVMSILGLAAVKDHVIGRQTEEFLPVDRAARIGKHLRIELALDEHELLGGCPALPGIDDDRAVHPVRDVERHRRGSAVIHERPRHTGDESVGQRIVRHEIHIRATRRNFRGVKVQAVRHRRLIHEREVHGVAFGDAEDGAWNAPVEGPRVIGHAIGNHDLCMLDRDPEALQTAGRTRRSNRIDRGPPDGRADRRFAVGDVGRRICRWGLRRPGSLLRPLVAGQCDGGAETDNQETNTHQGLR